MMHAININDKRLDMDNICDTFITPYRPVDTALDWILKKHPELEPFKIQVKEIICEWQIDQTLMDMD